MIKKFKNFIKEAIDDVGVGGKYLAKKGIETDINNFNKLYKTFLNIQNKEEIFTYKYQGRNINIIKNPTSLENIGENVRGIIDKDGDLFVEENSIMTHNDMLNLLETNNLVKNVHIWWRKLPTEFITVQRMYDKNLFVLGESNEMMYDKKSKEYQEAEPIFKKFLDKAKLKNPKINFINIEIDIYRAILGKI